MPSDELVRRVRKAAASPAVMAPETGDRVLALCDRVDVLEAENARLREALRRFAWVRTDHPSGPIVVRIAERALADDDQENE